MSLNRILLPINRKLHELGIDLAEHLGRTSTHRSALQPDASDLSPFRYIDGIVCLQFIIAEEWIPRLVTAGVPFLAIPVGEQTSPEVLCFAGDGPLVSAGCNSHGELVAVI